MNNRCEECGSWDSECGSPKPILDCGCNRCLSHTNKVLREALKWYVDNDDTMNTKYNEPWLEGKRRAMKLLGMEEDDDTL